MVKVTAVLRIAAPLSFALLAIWSKMGADESGVAGSQSPEAEADSPFVTVEREAQLGDSITSSRSFLYAPPPMPHTGMKQDDCLNCHAPEYDIKKRWRAIRPISHQLYSQCLQCHVEQSRPAAVPFVLSDFLALDLPGKGSRNNEYAPPTVPHKVFMRENCLSCHGATGYSDYRTSHPERSQCLQCHAPEASADYTRP